MSFKIGILLDSLQLPFSEALKFAASSGADGIQMYAVSHSMSALNLNHSKAKTIKQKVKDHKLEISALCGDLGGHGFELKKENADKIIKTKEVINFANDLEVGTITTHIGVVSAENTEKRQIMQEALTKLCRYAGDKGISLAIETGPEKSAVLKNFIEEIGESNLKVNLDPANLVMVQGEDPSESVRLLKDHIIHTHAKDGLLHRKCDPVLIYNAFAEGNPENIDIDSFFTEEPLGKGDVNFNSYLKVLDEIGYNGYLTIEREAGNNRRKDISDGIRFLKKII